MKKSTLSALTIVLSIFLTVFIFSSCKKKFDEPPAFELPNISSNTTIAQLKSLHTSVGAFDKIADTSNMIISGIVVADDYSGCFYKQIVIQDPTGAIVLLLNNKSLFLNYPKGRQVFVKVHGLVLSDDKYNGYQTLGMIDYSIPNTPASTGIPSANIAQYVIQGSTGNAVVPFKPAFSALTTGNLQDPFLGAFVQLDSMEFPVADTSVNWGDSTPTKAYVTIPAKNCAGNTINFNTSPYCNFAGVKVPFGNGSVSGIYSYSSKAVNGTKLQMLLVDTADVKMNHVRCNGTFYPPNYIYNGLTDFASIVTKQTIALNGWYNIGEVGGILYSGYVGSTGSLASITAFKVATAPITSWLISPTFTIPASAKSPSVNFNCIDGYDNGATLGLYVGTYNGNNTPSQAPNSWTKLPYTAPSGKTTGYSTLTPSGLIDLSAYKGQTIRLGFRYDGDATHNTTFEFDGPQVTMLP